MLNKHKEFFLALGPLIILVIIFGILFFRTNQLRQSPKALGENTQAKQISPNYYDYSAANLEKATDKGKAVLFFSTNWCSTCTELDRQLRQESNKLDPGITVLKLDFDKDTQLKKKYGVTVQHTLVQVDDKGNEITKWVGGDIKTINESVI